MHPTIDEQLSGALRLLSALDAADASDEVREVLANVHRLLRHVQRANISAPAFYRQDNRELAELLTSLDTSPVDTQLSLVADDDSGGRRNTELRAQLSQAIEQLQPGAAEWDRIGRYLLHRINQDPT